jgi:small subunit ribosomal protein S20
LLAALQFERVFRRKTLANIKSQIKRNKQNEKRRLRNRMYRGSTRAAVRDARSAIDDGNADESKSAVLDAISALDKAAAKGVIHKNNAARRKSRLMKHLASLDTDVEFAKSEEEAPKKKAAAKKSSKKSK